ncbi:MAG: 23S rRNA (adenine(2030)-N(6))-methyltransferase RlmJ [Opitutaceae bacterium]|nr:23S rRNA (adenine(2030)-N(6))-methyltransferase RlmJ [Opitutaceae bacterium]
MNYRHHFHAGNFADVMKHALFVRLLRALQRKEKGILYLDTHAGRGRYDLAAAAAGDTLARRPEWPDGIGRLWALPAGDVPAGLGDYLALVRDFDRRAGNLDGAPRFYPGSPWLAHALARPVDRLVFCEKHPAECGALRAEFAGLPRVAVQEDDGYTAVRALLPPRERRALLLMDPPFEEPDEFARLATALAEGLQRFPSGTYAIWYPLTARAKADAFLNAVRNLAPPPALALELDIAGADAAIKLKGCGVLVLNPPWQFEAEARAIVTALAGLLAQAPGAAARVQWIVPER